MTFAADIVQQVNEVDRWMPAIVAMIGSTGAVLGIVLPVLFSNRKKASLENLATREQITNGHPEHIRETLDRHQRETLAAVKEVKGEVATIRSDIGGIRSELRGIRDHGATQDERLLDLERIKRTGPRRG